MGKSGSWKLDEAKVQIIKDLLTTGDYNHQQIGDFFGVSREHIWKIANNQRWVEVDETYRPKRSNDFRQFTEPNRNTRDKLKVKNITITLEDGRELDLR
jgi:hypothetical protein